MAYSATWDETQPLGTAAANTIDDLFRSYKRDLRERLNDALGISDFATADPIRIGILRYTNKIIPPASGFLVRNNADSADNLNCTDAGALTVRASVTAPNITATSSLAGTLGTAAQPNITSVGTLTSLTVNGATSITGALTVNNNNLSLNGAAGTDRSLVFLTSGSGRWVIRAGSTGEGGANAGSNFHLDRYSDGGVYLSTAIDIVRSSGQINLNHNINAAGTLTVATGLTVTAGGITGTLNTAAQPNITSVGTLGSLTVTGGITCSSNLEIGSQSVAGNTFIDFHSDGAATDFNARVVRATGTNGALSLINTGSGNIEFATNGTTRYTIDVSGHLVPGANNSYDLGSSANKFRSIYAGTSVFTDKLITASTNINYQAGTHFWVNATDTIAYGSISSTLLQTNVPILLGSVSIGQRISWVGALVSLRNAADTADNLLITDAGALTVRSTITGSAGITVGTNLTFSNATAKIIPGATSLVIRNNGDTVDNLSIANNGAINLNGASRAIQMNGTQVVGNRVTGWSSPTGSAVTSEGNYDVNTVTLQQLGQQVAWLIRDLKAHGLIGA